MKVLDDSLGIVLYLLKAFLSKMKDLKAFCLVGER